MKKRWSVLLAYDVPYYATVIVEAETAEEAERLALTKDTDFNPCWDACTATYVADPAVEVLP